MLRRRARASAAVVATFCAACVIAAPAGAASVDLAAGAVRTAIERFCLAGFDSSFRVRADESARLTALYHARAYEPLWVDSRAQPSASAREVLALVSRAGDHGLDPEEYAARPIGRAAEALAASPPSADAAARFDVGVSAAFLRYLRHVHAGRIDPRKMGFRVESPVDEHDYAALMLAAIARNTIAATAASLTPRLAIYDGLRASLRHYRELAADPALMPLPAVSTPIHAGEPCGGASALYLLLRALGDLPHEAPPPAADLYEGALVDGVIRFQIRHGLAADGVLGPRTHEAMNTPLAWRVRQIELALERLRWLPDAGEDRIVLVNVPMFHLWAWDANPPAGRPAVSSDVIVGRAFRTRTPLFVADLLEVIFRPYWNVPASILRNEILPLVRRDPGYLARNDMELVSIDGGRVVPPTVASIARLGRDLTVRQRPGPRNSLGLVKFVLPNQDSIYMHDTPARALFSRSRRDFSHGCVRVRDPVALAEWALAATPHWTRDRIGAAMLGEQTIRAAVVRPTRVVLFYATAAIWPDDGMLRFADDIYHHDQSLDRALRSGKR